MKFKPKSESTRQYIIETTAGIFNTKGYAGTSMSDLTEATKLTKGSIYGNFENKEAVALAAFDYNLSKRQEALRIRVAACNTYKEKLMANIDQYNNAPNELFVQGGCPLMNTAVEADDTHEGLRKKAAEGLMGWKASLASLIREGIEAKEFRADIDPDKTALSVLAIIEGAILISKATKNTGYLSAILESAKDLVDRISVIKI